MEKEHKHHWGYFRDNMMVCNGCSETRTVKEVITELTRNEAITSELVDCLKERLKIITERIGDIQQTPNTERMDDAQSEYHFIESLITKYEKP